MGGITQTKKRQVHFQFLGFSWCLQVHIKKVALSFMPTCNLVNPLLLVNVKKANLEKAREWHPALGGHSEQSLELEQFHSFSKTNISVGESGMPY